MIETIKHLLGLCGEPHGLLHAILTLGGITALLNYIRRHHEFLTKHR